MGDRARSGARGRQASAPRRRREGNYAARRVRRSAHGRVRPRRRACFGAAGASRLARTQAAKRDLRHRAHERSCVGSQIDFGRSAAGARSRGIRVPAVAVAGGALRLASPESRFRGFWPGPPRRMGAEGVRPEGLPTKAARCLWPGSLRRIGAEGVGPEGLPTKAARCLWSGSLRRIGAEGVGPEGPPTRAARCLWPGSPRRIGAEGVGPEGLPTKAARCLWSGSLRRIGAEGVGPEGPPTKAGALWQPRWGRTLLCEKSLPCGRDFSPDAFGSDRPATRAAPRAGHSLRIACPPNSLRIAASSLSAKESFSRERKRSINEAVMTGADTSRSIASATVQRPSPESST